MHAETFCIYRLGKKIEVYTKMLVVTFLGDKIMGDFCFLCFIFPFKITCSLKKKTLPPGGGGNKITCKYCVLLMN